MATFYVTLVSVTKEYFLFDVDKKTRSPKWVSDGERTHVDYVVSWDKPQTELNVYEVEIADYDLEIVGIKDLTTGNSVRRLVCKVEHGSEMVVLKVGETLQTGQYTIADKLGISRFWLGLPEEIGLAIVGADAKTQRETVNAYYERVRENSPFKR